MAIAQRMREILGDGCQNWIQGHYRALHPNGHFCYCLKGAFLMAAPVRGKEREEGNKLLLKAVRIAFPKSSFYGGWPSVEAFNDLAERTPEDILLVLDKLAELEKAEAP